MKVWIVRRESSVQRVRVSLHRLERQVGMRLKRLKVLAGVVELIDHGRCDDPEAENDNAAASDQRCLAPAGGDETFEEEIEHLR